MSLPNFPTSSFTTARGLTYNYIHIPPSNLSPSAARYILLLHGWPSIPTDFHQQIKHLTHLGYGILAPTLLGYYPSSTPSDPSLYALKAMCTDLLSLIDHVSIRKPLHAGIGHDWGATLLSRLEYYHPESLSRLVYLSIGPVPLGQLFDLDSVNAMTREHLGYEGFGYQKFIMDDVDRAAQLMEENHEKMERLMFAKESNALWKEYFGRVGGLEHWLTNDALAPDTEMVPAVSGDLLARRREVFVAQPDSSAGDDECGRGYRSSLAWYVAHNTNINVKDERASRSDWKTYQTSKNVLLIVGDKDPIALAPMQQDMARSYCLHEKRQLHVASVSSGHFMMVETASQVNKHLEQFLKD